MDGQEAASIAVGVLFAILTLINLVNFKLTMFRVYILSAFSCALRAAGFSIRAVYFRDLANGTNDHDLAPTWQVLALAGYGISLAVVALMMGCWFKNAGVAQQYARFKLSVRVRLLIAPFIIFGPIMGCTSAGLVYGDGSPSALATARRTTLAGAWGMFGALVVLFAAACFASWVALAARISAAKPSPAAKADSLVLITLWCGCMGTMASVFKLVGLYHPQYNVDANLYFPLQVLPQLIAVCIISFPRLLAEISMGAGYEAWQAGQVAAPKEAAAEANGKHEQAV